jgi:uncharacterized protein (TIGR02996 family)
MDVFHDDRAVELRAAISSEPDSDVPRLMYADWLEQTGDEDARLRAEFIRVQCYLASHDGFSPHCGAMQARSRELVDRAQRLIHVELPQRGDVNWMSLRRGFFEHALLSGDDACGPSAAEIVAHSPVISVLMFAPEASTLTDVLARPEFDKITRLAIKRIAHPAEVNFSAWAGLPKLTSLSLLGCQIYDTQLKKLLDWHNLTRLKELSLSVNNITDAGVVSLAQSPTVARLERLNLEGNSRIGARGVDAIIESPFLRNLKQFRFSIHSLPREVRERLQRRFLGQVWG